MMARYQSARALRERAAAAGKDLVESKLTIPDALIEWARVPDRQIHWARPFGDEVAALVEEARREPLPPGRLETLLSRLEPIVAAARAAGRGDLLVGFDTQTAEWLGLHFHVQTARGPMHVGPDPRTQPREGAKEPPWTYREVDVVHQATAALNADEARQAVDLAWTAKELISEVFPGARIDVLEQQGGDRRCVACGEVLGPVMLATEDRGEYHTHCWSERVKPPMPTSKR